MLILKLKSITIKMIIHRVRMVILKLIANVVENDFVTHLHGRERLERGSVNMGKNMSAQEGKLLPEK